MTADGMFFLAAAALLGTCLASLGARALTEFSRRELEEICRRRKSPQRLGEILRRHDRVALAAETLQVVGTVVVIVAGGLWLARQAARLGAAELWPAWIAEPGWPVAAAGIAVGALALLAAEIWIPWAVARLWAAPFAYYTWPFWRAVDLLLTPLTLGARFVDTLVHRLAGRQPEPLDEESFEEEIRTIVTEGHREGLLEEDARDMIEGIIELSDVDVSEIMTPRTDMISISVHLSWNEALELVVRSGHTRIPVYERNRDDIIGILVVKDLLPELAKGPAEPSRPWPSLLREPFFVPETKPLDALLQEFQKTRNHMAVVLDEYGGVSGLVTLEDILEEIVGEIVDEYDQDLVDGIRIVGEGAFEVMGTVHIDEINERLEIELPDDGDFDTIAGLVFSEMGHVPVSGEDLVVAGVRITVLEATRRRILRVRLDLVDQPQRETA